MFLNVNGFYSQETVLFRDELLFRPKTAACLLLLHKEIIIYTYIYVHKRYIRKT